MFRLKFFNIGDFDIYKKVMGYLLFLLIFLIWLNVRQIKKAYIYLARKEGYPKTLLSRIIDIIADYQKERKAIKKTILDNKNKTEDAA